MTKNKKDDYTRLFFAIWPSSSVRKQLIAIQKQQAPKQASLVSPDNLHITLVFLGSMSAEQQHCVVALANTIDFQPFQITLDQLQYRKRQQMLWLCSSKIPDELHSLYAVLSAGLAPCGYVAAERAFIPHVALTRKQGKPQKGRAMAPLTWPVNGFALVESQTLESGAVYRVLKTWQ